MGLVVTLVIGLLVGLVARLIYPGRNAQGYITTSLLGIAGSFLASWLGQAAGLYQVGEPAGFIASVIGALLLLGAYQAISKNKV